ncbi:MAG: hypothetical protein QXU20_03095 [Candidatus Woesearchaeota archaeon]
MQSKKNKIVYSNKRKVKKYTRILLGFLLLVFGVWLLKIWKEYFFDFLKGLAILLIILIAISLIFLSWSD